MTTRWNLATAVLFADDAATIASANWASTLWPAVAVVGLQTPAGAFISEGCPQVLGRRQHDDRAVTQASAQESSHRTDRLACTSRPCTTLEASPT